MRPQENGAELQQLCMVCPNAMRANANVHCSSFCSKSGADSFECPIDEASPLLIEESDHEAPVTAIGFRIGNGLLHSGEAQWAVLRDQIELQRNTSVKSEVHEVDIQDVYFSQRSC